MDEGDKQNKETQRERTPIDGIQRYFANVSDVLSSVWLRCPIQNDYGYYRFILDSRRSFLSYFRMFLVIVYLSFELYKQTK